MRTCNTGAFPASAMFAHRPERFSGDCQPPLMGGMSAMSDLAESVSSSVGSTYESSTARIALPASARSAGTAW